MNRKRTKTVNRTFRASAAAVWLAGLLLALPAAGQSVLERTPNLSGGWVGADGTVHFNFLHRFHAAGATNKLVNWPGFLLGYSFADAFLAGVHYTSFSRLVEGEPNEFEPFLRFGLLRPGLGLPVSVALTGAYNTAAESVDGELALGVPLGQATLHGVLRGFSSGLGTEEARAAAGGGVSVRLSDNVALAGDVVTPLRKREGEVLAWGAALQLAIPFTPHTFSLQAANTNSSTLQGSSSRALLGRKGTRWGFEFTVPITLSRYFGGGGGGPSGQDVTVTADTVRVPIRDFEFATPRLVVRPGTTVVWVNEGGVAHNSISDTNVWAAPLLAPGESYARVFNEPGEFPYHCGPHPFMQGVVVVQSF